MQCDGKQCSRLYVPIIFSPRAFMAMVSQIHPLFRCVGKTAYLRLVAVHAQHIVVYTKVDVVFISDSREIKVIANFVIGLYNIHCWHDSGGHTLLM